MKFLKRLLIHLFLLLNFNIRIYLLKSLIKFLINLDLYFKIGYGIKSFFLNGLIFLVEIDLKYNLQIFYFLKLYSKIFKYIKFLI